MKWENVLKNPNKMLCPMCGNRTFGSDIRARGKNKNIFVCTECGHKQVMRR